MMMRQIKPYIPLVRYLTLLRTLNEINSYENILIRVLLTAFSAQVISQDTCIRKILVLEKCTLHLSEGGTTRTHIKVDNIVQAHDLKECFRIHTLSSRKIASCLLERMHSGPYSVYHCDT